MLDDPCFKGLSIQIFITSKVYLFFVPEKKSFKTPLKTHEKKFLADGGIMVGSLDFKWLKELTL